MLANQYKKKSITVLQGVFNEELFESLNKRKVKEVFVLEGRPSLEAAQHAAKELKKRKIKTTLIADNMAGFLFSKDLVKEINLAYQAIDDDGAICQIGALILAVLAKKHKVPVNLYQSQKEHKLLGRQSEIFQFNGVKVAPRGIQGYVPLVDMVPKKYITNIN